MAASGRAPAPAKSFTDLIGSGDRRTGLLALRDRLARELESTDRDVASLARQLREVIREIDELPALQQESTLDDLANRRASRRAKAAAQ